MKRQKKTKMQKAMIKMQKALRPIKKDLQKKMKIDIVPNIKRNWELLK